MKIISKKDKIAEGLKGIYTMHTATLKMQLTYQDMEIVKKIMFEELEKGINIIKYFKKKESKCKKVYIFLTSERWKFNYIKIVKCRTNSYDHYWMEIKINPRAMLHSSEYPFVYVASKEDIEACIRIIYKFGKETGVNWVNSEMFYIQRIDYCVNIYLGDEDMVATYMRLMRKGAYPYKAKRMKEYSATGKRYIDTQNSFTVTSGSFEFSIYNKYKQLKEEEKKYSDDEIEKAKGVIRIELRIDRNKVRREEIKHDTQSIDEFLKITSQIAQENIPRYLAISYGTGIFVKFQDAKRVIQETTWKKKTKKEMKNILQIVSKHNLQEVKELYKDKFPYYMNHFNQIKISPITLSSNSAYKSIQNPLYYVENHCVNNER